MNPALSVSTDSASRIEKKSLCRRVFRFLERLLAIFGLIILVYLCLFDLSQIVSQSMSPTLMGTDDSNGDWVLTERVSYTLRAPRRWELLAFKPQDGIQVIKRIVALPGESLTLKKDGTFLADGHVVERPECLKSVKYYPVGSLFRDVAVPAGDGYFVLGDYSRNSDDSRYNPPVKKERVVGRPWLIVWPLSRFGFVNP